MRPLSLTLLLAPLALLGCGEDCADGYGLDGDGNCVPLAAGADDTGGASADDTGGASADDTGAQVDTDVGAAEILEVSSEITEKVVTVVRVRWTTAEAASGYVEFGEDETYGHTTLTTESGTEHEVLLLGMPSETEVHFRVVLDDGAVVSDDLTITTGILPAELPELYATGEAPSWDGYIVVPLQGSTHVISILDNQGRYVWYDILEGGANLMRAIFSVDGESMVYCLAGQQNDLSQGKVERVSMDAEERREFAWPYIDHDMVELPDGTLAGIVVTQDPSGGIYQADRIVEVDLEGNSTQVWSAWDEVDPEEAGITWGGTNWTHGNALDYDPVEDTYYFSSKEIGTIFKIPRATGEAEWMLNGQLNEFTFETGVKVDMQHQFEMLENGNILIFDNGHSDRGYSRMVEYELDQENLIANEVWDYVRDPSVYVYAKGDVARFPDGNSQVVWSTSGEIQDVTPDGEVIWQLNVGLGGAITFISHVDDLYGR